MVLFPEMQVWSDQRKYEKRKNLLKKELPLYLKIVNPTGFPSQGFISFQI